MMKFITARFSSKCAETNTTINKGDNILYDAHTKKVYCSRSAKYQDEAEQQSIASYIQGQEEACFDNFCNKNNI